MKSYWKVRTPHERRDSDLAALYGGKRYFKTAIEAEYRCQELNDAHDQKPELLGTFNFQERFYFAGVPEDKGAESELGPVS